MPAPTSGGRQHLSPGQYALSDLLWGVGYWTTLRNLKAHFAGMTTQEARSYILDARRARDATQPGGLLGRYRDRDIPIMGPWPSLLPTTPPRNKYQARGIGVVTDERTGEKRYFTVYYNYSRLPGRKTILKDLLRQAADQLQASRYKTQEGVDFDESTLDVVFETLTRSF